MPQIHLLRRFSGTHFPSAMDEWERADGAEKMGVFDRRC
jgi:hypothetical protein